MTKSSKSVLAGDFNFRLDLKPLWEAHQVPSTDRLEPKKFRSAFVDAALAAGHNGSSLMVWDNELQRLNATIAPSMELIEMERPFPPTYCLRDGESGYNAKRCPAWTDRVVLTPELRRVLAPSACVVYEARNWGCDHHIVSFLFELSPMVPPEKRMRHAPDPELGLGKLILDKDQQPRRRRGVWNASTFLAVGLIIATGVFLYHKIK